MIEKIKQTAKAWVALVVLILTAIIGMVPESWAPRLAIALAVAGAISVWATPNAAPSTPADPDQPAAGVPPSSNGD